MGVTRASLRYRLGRHKSGRVFDRLFDDDLGSTWKMGEWANLPDIVLLIQLDINVIADQETVLISVCTTWKLTSHT